MNKTVIIATGGTGGHLFPAQSLAEILSREGYSIYLTTDKRGLKFLKNSSKSNVKLINSSRLEGGLKVFSIFKLFFSFMESIFYLIRKKPRFIFGMGGYASFPVCFAAVILRIPVLIYENNLHIGKTNRILSVFSKKIFLSYKETEGISKKIEKNIKVIGNILRNEIFDIYNKKKTFKEEELKIFIMGGSQAAKIFGEKIPEILVKCKNRGINLEVYQQCLPNQNKSIMTIYQKNQLKFELFNFNFDVFKYYNDCNLVISRAGSSALAEMLNCRIPIISIPLKTAADNHQYKNARYFEKKGYCVVITEEQLENKLFQLLHTLHKDKSLLNQIIEKQKKHTDRDVVKKVCSEIKKLFYEN